MFVCINGSQGCMPALNSYYLKNDQLRYKIENYSKAYTKELALAGTIATLVKQNGTFRLNKYFTLQVSHTQSTLRLTIGDML